MYQHKDYEQLELELPFGVALNRENRWVQLAEIIPWDIIDEEYKKNFPSNEGQIAKPARLAFGALYIQTEEDYTDEQTRRNIQENPYLQYFCGFACYTMESPFDASMMTHFRKRISPEMLQRINELVFREEAAKSMEAKESTKVDENRGTLILDATCCPSDIHYPTDAGLLNHARELTEGMVDKLYAAVKDWYPKKPRMYRRVARKKYLAYAKKRRHTAEETRSCIQENLQYLRRDIGYLEQLVKDGAPLDILGNKTYRKMLVIRELYRQQLEMFQNKSHVIADRIVSIDQPHVRPIVRGKAGVPVEFGAKVTTGLVGGYAFLVEASWDNYAEGNGLKPAAERYREIFGFYPKTILADRAYPSRENRAWCKDKHIRLSGPRLGRRSSEEKKEEQKQIYKDGCERVVIEGTFGVCKRRFHLDRVMTRLPGTSMTSIAMTFFTANMERKLRLLFAPSSPCALIYDYELHSLCLMAA